MNSGCMCRDQKIGSFGLANDRNTQNNSEIRDSDSGSHPYDLDKTSRSCKMRYSGDASHAIHMNLQPPFQQRQMPQLAALDAREVRLGIGQ